MPTCRIVTALPAEARPIVRRYGLQPRGDGRYRSFRGDGLELIVSGVGASAAAAAVRHLGGDGGRRPIGWLNVGIAGHRELQLGTPRLAHKIVEAATGRAWYPPTVFEPPCTGATVRTVDEVEFEPADGALYEMEAAGFYAAASRRASAELIQVLKVVSDNHAAGPERLTAERVEELIEANLAIVATLLDEIASIAASLEARSQPPAALDDFLGRWHFTVTQGRQLERLLRRLEALGRPAAAHDLGDSASAAVVLTALRERI